MTGAVDVNKWENILPPLTRFWASRIIRPGGAVIPNRVPIINQSLMGPRSAASADRPGSAL